MSFSKSKVERFPFSSNSKGSKTPGSGILGSTSAGSGRILKRSYYVFSSPSTSMMSTSGSSFHSTPSRKDNLKQRRPLQDESKTSNSAQNKKSPVQRIPVLNRSHNRTVLTKPKFSPVYRGKILNMTGKTKQTTPGKRKQLMTSGSKKTPKKKDCIPAPSPKRKKFDETSDEMYLTPLTSPPNSSTDESTNDANTSSTTIIFDPQSVSRCLKETIKSNIIEDEDQETFTPTALFESTRLEVNATPIPIQPSEPSTENQSGGRSSPVDTENLENLFKDVVISDEKEEEATVTTPGRNPSRKSVTKQNISIIEASSSSANRSVERTSFTADNFTLPDDEHTSRISVSSRTQQWSDSSGSYDFMNDAFLQQQQLSLQDSSERHSRFFQSVTANPQAVMRASDDLYLGLSVTDVPRDSQSHRTRAQSLSSYTNYDFPGHGRIIADDEPIPPVKPPSISSRIGSLMSTIFPKKNKRENLRSAAELQIFAEHNYLPLTRDGSSGSHLRRRPRRLGANSFIPAAFREFIFREPPFQARFNREVLRRLGRMIRLETSRTIREIRVSIILPAKMYAKSPEFWMPVVEFVAGQALEITLTSLRQ